MFAQVEKYVLDVRVVFVRFADRTFRVLVFRYMFATVGVNSSIIIRLLFPCAELFCGCAGQT